MVWVTDVIISVRYCLRKWCMLTDNKTLQTSYSCSSLLCIQWLMHPEMFAINSGGTRRAVDPAPSPTLILVSQIVTYYFSYFANAVQKMRPDEWRRLSGGWGGRLSFLSLGASSFIPLLVILPFPCPFLLSFSFPFSGNTPLDAARSANAASSPGGIWGKAQPL